MKELEAKQCDMLECRERRVQIQNAYLEKYHYPVLSFCMNIPGPVKTNESIRKAFEAGKQELMARLIERNFLICAQTEIHEKTGDELILSICCPAAELKKEAVRIEETLSFGRLFDMDVIDETGKNLSRSFRRSCIVCGKPVWECARSRAHSIEELQVAVDRLLQTSNHICQKSLPGSHG